MTVYRNESIQTTLKQSRAGGPNVTGLRQVQAGITTEVVDAVNGDGSYMVRGFKLRAYALAQLAPGDRVRVAWRDGKAVVILRHQARRSGRGVQEGQVPGLAEQLFIADDGTGADVYFRNATTVGPLGVTEVMGLAPEIVQWGHDRDSFVVLAQRRFFLFELGREAENVAFAPGVLPEATLLETLDLDASGLTLLDLTAIRQGSGNRITATQPWEETRTAQVTSQAFRNPIGGDPPGVCAVNSTSTSCRTAAQLAALQQGVGPPPPSPPNCPDGAEWFISTTEPAPADAHLGVVKRDNGACSITLTARRTWKLNAALWNDDEVTPTVADIVLSAPMLDGKRHVIVSLLLAVDFRGNFKAGDTYVMSSTRMRWAADFNDPHWTTPLTAFADTPDTSRAEVVPGFDIKEGHAYLIDVTANRVLYATTGAHSSPAKTITTQETYNWLDTAILASAFDGPLLVYTGVGGHEPARAGTLIGSKGSTFLAGAYAQVTGDALFIGVGLATFEVARVRTNGVPIELETALKYDHWAGEAIRPSPALVYWEPEQIGDPVCNTQRSLVDSAQPVENPGGSARAMALGSLGVQGRTAFANDLWDPASSPIGLSSMYETESYAVSGCPGFGAASYVISIPLNYGDDFFTGLIATWGFTAAVARQANRFSVDDFRVLRWAEDLTACRFWMQLRRHDNLTGENHVRGLVVDGTGRLIFTPVAEDREGDGFMVLWDGGPHHAIAYSEQGSTPGLFQAIRVVDLDTTLVVVAAAAVGPGKTGGEDGDGLFGKLEFFDPLVLRPDQLYAALPNGREDLEDFVAGWDASGVVVLAPQSAAYPEVDAELAGRGRLLTLPEELSTTRTQLDVQALNPDDVLGTDVDL